MSPHQLRVNVLATREGLVYMDTFDLCKAKSRSSFIKVAAAELYSEEQLIKRDVGRLLLELEQLQLAQIDAATKPKENRVELTAYEKRMALALLRSPDLVQCIVQDYDRCGLVGEETNKQVCYLACVSRLLPQPLAVLIQSGSAAGKTSLMDATLAFIPEEHQVRYSGMTGQSLVMGQSLDALLPQTRQLLLLIDDYVNRRAHDLQQPRSLMRFTQRELRESLGWSDFQVRKHLARLVQLEYVLTHRSGQGNQRQYELLYDGQGRDGEKFLLGLADTSQLNGTPSNERNEQHGKRNEPRPSPSRAPSGPGPCGTKPAAKRGTASNLRRTGGKPGKKVKRT